MEQREIERLLGGPPRLAYRDIVAHPRLALARRAYLGQFLKVYGDDPFHARLLIETGRFLVYLVVVTLEAMQDPARRETWLTIRRLKEGMALFGLASDRHIDALVARLCSVGYMRRRRAEEDRRVQILEPTERLRVHDCEWIAAHFAPLAALYPGYDYAPALKRDPAFQAVFRRVSPPFMPLGAKLMVAVPEMLLFLNHAGGYLVIATLLQAAMEEGGDASLVAVPYSAVGDRFGVSRTQVRNMLREAEAMGLVKLHARGGRKVEILPRLIDCHDRGMACGMYIHDMLFVAARRAEGAPWRANERLESAAEPA